MAVFESSAASQTSQCGEKFTIHVKDSLNKCENFYNISLLIICNIKGL